MRIPPYGFTEPVIALSTDETASLGVPVEILKGRTRRPFIVVEALA